MSLQSWWHDETANNRAMSLFAGAIRKHRSVFMEGMLGTVMVSLIGLATSMFSMQVYDRVIPSNGLNTLWVLTFGVAVAMLFEMALKQVRAIMIDKACKQIDLELSDRFFGAAMDIRLDHRPAAIGTFAAQIRLFESVRNFLTSTTLFVLADLPFALLFIVVIWLIAGPVALVPLLLLPVSIVAGLFFLKPIERLTALGIRESTLKNGLLIESIDGIETIKALQSDAHFKDRWHALTQKIGEDELELKWMSGLSGNITQFIQQASYVGMVVVGVSEIVSGHLTMGGLIASTIISGRALGPIAQISGVLVQWQHAKISLKGLDAILASPKDGELAVGETIHPETAKAALSLNNVSFFYQEKHPILDIPQLAIAPGDRVGLIGPIGSGKTTLLKLLAGLYHPKEGRVFLDGVAMDQLAPAFVRQQIDYLPQDARLFNGTLRENLTLGQTDVSDEALLTALRQTGLDRMIADHPLGINLPIFEGGMGLSGGQRQLVTLARLALANKSICLLDEPTASLDGPAEDAVVQELIGRLPTEGILVMSTHKLNLLQYTSRLIFMDKGKILLDGPRDAVLAKLASVKQGAQKGEAA